MADTSIDLVYLAGSARRCASNKAGQIIFKEGEPATDSLLSRAARSISSSATACLARSAITIFSVRWR